MDKPYALSARREQGRREPPQPYRLLCLSLQLVTTKVQRQDSRRCGEGYARPTYHIRQTIDRFFFVKLSQVRNAYSSLFGDSSERAETQSGANVSTFQSKYGWLYTVDNLTNGRPELWEFYFEMNIVEFLNRLAYQKARGAYDRQQQRKP
jgi:hypothetical protein